MFCLLFYYYYFLIPICLFEKSAPCIDHRKPMEAIFVCLFLKLNCVSPRLYLVKKPLFISDGFLPDHTLCSGPVTLQLTLIFTFCFPSGSKYAFYISLCISLQSKPSEGGWCSMEERL